MRVIAIIASYNEERFIAACLENLIGQKVDVYLIDNCSTDRTLEIAGRYLNRGLIGIETFPRTGGVYKWHGILERKEELATTLDADWFMHADPDEIRLPPPGSATLAEALAEADAQGHNAVNFMEYTFIPTREAPDHDHADFQRTMRWYYPFLPSFPHRLNAWRRSEGRVELAWSDGHQVRFPGLRMYPVSFPMRHYLFLSVAHLERKYVGVKHDQAELRRGWWGWRDRVKPERVRLPSQDLLRHYESDQKLDPSSPRRWHIVEEQMGARSFFKLSYWRREFPDLFGRRES
ncbi:MAG TPA: glycosyltransferase family A protein [Pyrinomonadaceae bacterium]